MSQNLTPFDGIFPKSVGAVRAASSLAAQDINFFTSLDQDVSKDVKDASASLLALANKLLAKSAADYDFIEYGEDNIVSKLSWKRVSDALDNCFEKADLALDEMKNPKPSGAQVTYMLDSTSDEKAPDVKIKPQINFREAVDNSDSHPFRPKLTEKPHALKSLEESLKLDFTQESEDGKISTPCHKQPYEFEIMNQPYPESAVTLSLPIPSTDWASTTAIWVDTVELLREMISSLLDLTEIAVDLEHHDYRTYYGVTCLMQISNRDQDWIVDTLALHDDLKELNQVFANPQILKVLHGANMDIIWLQRDLGLYIVSLFDTYHASKKLGFPKFSLAYLLETFAKFKTSKKYQLADWRVRPLTSAMMQYARADTHFLLNIYDQLRNKLITAGQGKIQEVLYESRKVARRRFEFNKFKTDINDNWLSMSSQMEPDRWIISQFSIEPERQGVVKALIGWRDKVARDKDESTRFVMLNHVLASLSLLSAPIDSQNVINAAGTQYLLVRQNAKELAGIIMEHMKSLNHQPKSDDQSSKFDLKKIDFGKATEIFNHFTKIIKKSPLSSVNDSLVGVEESQLLSNFGSYPDTDYAIRFGKLPSDCFHIKSDQIRERAAFLNDKFMGEFNSIVEAQKETVEGMNSLVVEGEPADMATSEASSVEKLEEDKDAIVVLSNRRSKKPSKIAAPQADEELFDYTSADKKVLEHVKNLNKKKRSFDPFSNQGTGPRVAKKSRQVNAGKSTSFVDRRK